MFIETIPNRTSPPATLLRESYRDEAGMRIKARVRPTPPGVTGKGKGPHLYAAADIGVAVGAVLDDSKMGKHFELVIRDGHFSWHRRTDAIERESRLDGLYVVRTSVPAADLSAAETVQAYKDLARVERAFRCLKTVDLDIRPIHHWNAERVRAHVFLCMLAYHVEWHLRQALAPLLFHDTDIAAARADRSSPVVPTDASCGRP